MRGCRKFLSADNLNGTITPNHNSRYLFYWIEDVMTNSYSDFLIKATRMSMSKWKNPVWRDIPHALFGDLAPCCQEIVGKRGCPPVTHVNLRVKYILEWLTQATMSNTRSTKTLFDGDVPREEARNILVIKSAADWCWPLCAAVHGLQLMVWQ